MSLPDAEYNRKWEEMRNAMILAMHSVMLSSEFKEQYWAEYNRQLSLSRQFDADKILQQFLSLKPDDLIPPLIPPEQ